MGLKTDMALETILRALTLLRWTALGNHLMKKADPVEFYACPPGMPRNLDEIPFWYASEYEFRISGPRNDMRSLNAAILNSGSTTEVFGPSSQHPCYPDGVAGRQIAAPANSKRQKPEQDTVKGGELYKRTADPGVFAGFSANHNLPLISGSWGVTKGYVWCPLRERMDLVDCVHRQIALSGLFQNVRLQGSGDHMTPYQSAFEWKGRAFSCGIDDEVHKVSSSGARLYMRSPLEECNCEGNHELENCFNLVLGLLPQQDLDDSAYNRATCRLKLKYGGIVRWAAMSNDAVFQELGLRSQVYWQNLSATGKSEAVL